MRGLLTVLFVGCIAIVIATTSSTTTATSSAKSDTETAVANVNEPASEGTLGGTSDLKRDVRQLGFSPPFQPSPQDQFKNQDAVGSDLGLPTGPASKPAGVLNEPTEDEGPSKLDEDDEFLEGRSLPGPLLHGQESIPPKNNLRLSISEAEDDANNTIDTASSGHYGHQVHQIHTHSFSPSYGQHHHTPSHKPLKASVVHRDPHAHFNEYDAIRTQDQDRHHQVYPSSAYNKHGSGSGHAHSHGHGYGQSHGSHYEKPTPYHYDTHLTPECAHKNRYYYNLTFCLEDSHYPTESILWAIQQSGHYAQKLLSDVTYQSADNTVDGLTRAEEEGYTYSHYFGGSHQQHHHMDKYKPPYTGYSYSHEYYKKGGYICPSDIYYARPRRAMNTYGKWKVLVNLDYVPNHSHGHGSYGHKQPTYTQTLRLEQCIYSNAPCSFIDSHVHSRCLQKHNFVRLVAWTYEEGLHIDTFKMPIACSCHISQQVHFYHPQPQPHHHITHHPAAHPVSHQSHHYSRGKK